MNRVLAIEELRQEFNKEKFIRKTQEQIAKDFQSVGVHLSSDFVCNIRNYDDLVQFVSKELQKLQHQSFAALHQLIYQIDLSEKLYAEAMSAEHPEVDLANSIIQREAYKVYLRTKF